MARITRRLPDNPSTVGYVLSCGCVLEIDRRTLLDYPRRVDLENMITRMAEQHDAACPRQRPVPTFMGVPIKPDPNYASDWLINWDPGPAVRPEPPPVTGFYDVLERSMRATIAAQEAPQPPQPMTAQEIRARQEEQYQRILGRSRHRSPGQVEAAMARMPVGFRPEQLAPLAGAPAAQAPKKEITPEKKDEWKKDRFELIELD